MINSTAFDYVNVLTKAADASYQREAILANNISNVDTPGYKRKDLKIEYVKKDRFRCWIISVMCCFVFYHTYSILPVRCYACIQPFNSTHHSF